MTREQKKKTRELLRLYGAARSGRARMDARLAAAVEEALDAAYRDSAVRGKLLELRYLDGRSVRETVAALYLGEGGTTYHKLDLEALSTAAVALAERGIALSGEE